VPDTTTTTALEIPEDAAVLGGLSSAFDAKFGASSEGGRGRDLSSGDETRNVLYGVCADDSTYQWRVTFDIIGPTREQRAVIVNRNLCSGRSMDPNRALQEAKAFFPADAVPSPVVHGPRGGPGFVSQALTRVIPAQAFAQSSFGGYGGFAKCSSIDLAGAFHVQADDSDAAWALQLSGYCD
jgi:hypothetical protein